MKTLREYIEQLTESTMDPETQNMLKVAKAKYPDATDDFSALATLVRKANNHSMADIKTLSAENDAEEADIDQLEIENDSEELAIDANSDKLDALTDELDQLRKQIATLTGKY
jgi:phage-related minor tail protein